MDWIKMFIICGSICGSICGMIDKNLTDDKVKELIADKIKDPNFDLTILTDGKQDSQNSFFQWILSFFSSSSTNEVMESNECTKCSCGRSNQSRVLGGTETGVNQYPWMALLLFRGDVFCGGSLINDRYVLTAAVCALIEKFETDLLVRLLEHDIYKIDESKSIERRVKTMIRHPEFTFYNYESNIALLELAQPVEFVGVLNPVCLPTPGLRYEGENGILTGYGRSDDGLLAYCERQVSVPILTKEKCTSKVNVKFTDNMICTGSYRRETTGFCDHDDGGPLHVVDKTTKIHQIVGIISYNNGCKYDDHPDVYTRVSEYETWINDNTKNACKCS